MWKLQTAQKSGESPFLQSLNHFQGRQVWEFVPGAGSQAERQEVEQLRAAFAEHRYDAATAEHRCPYLACHIPEQALHSFATGSMSIAVGNMRVLGRLDWMQIESIVPRWLSPQSSAVCCAAISYLSTQAIKLSALLQSKARCRTRHLTPCCLVTLPSMPRQHFIFQKKLNIPVGLISAGCGPPRYQGLGCAHCRKHLCCICQGLCCWITCS